MINDTKKFPHGEDTYKIIGACFEVYNEMGCGFLEPVYQECMEIELGIQNILFKSQQSLSLQYKGIKLKHTYEPDFICYDRIVLELKSVEKLLDEHRAQVLNYLNATGFEIGLLVNFGHYPGLEYERLIENREEKRSKHQCKSV